MIVFCLIRQMFVLSTNTIEIAITRLKRHKMAHFVTIENRTNEKECIM